MSSIIYSLPELYATYRKWVSKNPQKAYDFETTFKWFSYLIAGRFQGAYAVTELAYSVTNLLTFFNDRIITTERQLEIPSSGDQLKVWITVVTHAEIFFELTAKKLWGSTGRWIVILAIQVFKCIGKLLLVYHHKEGIVHHPPILDLDRRAIEAIALRNDPAATDLARAHFDSLSFSLRRSGKVIRKVTSSPDIRGRSWKPVEKFMYENDQAIEQSMAGQKLVAETIYIVKPIIHLGTMRCFGRRSWKPWIISLLLDLASLKLYISAKNMKEGSLTRKQRLQLSRRCVALVLYLLRTPFYNNVSESGIQKMLMGLSNNVPLAGYLCVPIAKYIPFWQSIYFNLWTC